MKAILTFNLPKDKDEFKLATKGINYFSAIFDFANALSNLDVFKDKDEIEMKFYEILDNWDIEIYNEVD